MAQCVLCAKLSSVYCTADSAFLCKECDISIHSANALSRKHKRLPVCELCKRQAASLYCHEDAAALCSGCEVEVHCANPLPHTVVSIEEALANGLVQSAGLPYLACQGSNDAPNVCCQPQPVQQAEDEVSACGHSEHRQGSVPLSSSEGNASLAVVPEMNSTPVGAQLSAPAAAFAGKDLKAVWGGKDDFDALDFEAAWLTGLDMGLDFSDILGNDASLDVPGTVPTLPAPEENIKPFAVPAPVAPEPLKQEPAFGLHLHSDNELLESVVDEDFVVPSFLPEELTDDEAAAPAIAATTALDEHSNNKRSASEMMSQPEQPHAKFAAMEVPTVPFPQQAEYHHQHMPMQPAHQPMYPAPMPMPVEQPVKQYKAPQQQPPSSLSFGNGANLTREQRVARYREKRKNRKFQKTIRYASRKAYAEVRPRIKGRFATKEEVEAWKARQAAGVVGPEDHLFT